MCSPRTVDEPAVTAPCRAALRMIHGCPPCHQHSAPALPRPPQHRPASRDDREAPLWQGPGWRVNDINPKFGKVEYFCEVGLTGCFARRDTTLSACRHCFAARAMTKVSGRAQPTMSESVAVNKAASGARAGASLACAAIDQQAPDALDLDGPPRLEHVVLAGMG